MDLDRHPKRARMEAVISALRQVRGVVERVDAVIGSVRKVIPPVLAAIAIVVGPDAVIYQEIVLLLSALGVYAIPNRTA